MTGTIDRFSTIAEGYARYRPRYPADLYEFLYSLQPHRTCAWDAGTGNGQVASALATVFNNVIATDISPEQLDKAPVLPNVRYHVCPAEHSEIETASVDLITVGQAVHWFDIGRFASEAQRVSRSHGVLAIWCYTLLESEPQIDALIRHLYEDILDGYWDPQRAFIERAYRDFDFPFTEVACPPFHMQNIYDVHDILGYLRTWSAVTKFLSKNHRDPVKEIESDLLVYCGDQKIECRTPIFMRAWRI